MTTVFYHGKARELFETMEAAQSAIRPGRNRSVYKWQYQATAYVGETPETAVVKGEIWQALIQVGGSESFEQGPTVRPWFNFDKQTLEGYIIED